MMGDHLNTNDGKVRKYTYYFVVQGNYGYGFEDLEFVNKHWDKDFCGPRYAPKRMYDHEYEGNPKVTNRYLTPMAYAIYLRNEYRVAYPNATYRIINRRELTK